MPNTLGINITNQVFYPMLDDIFIYFTGDHLHISIQHDYYCLQYSYNTDTQIKHLKSIKIKISN